MAEREALHVLQFLKRRGGSRRIARYEGPASWEKRRSLFAESGLFDREWYLTNYPDVRRSGRDPLDHLAEYGAVEWRNPGPGFDAAFYASANPSFKETGLSPLEHFLLVGRPAGVSPIDTPDTGATPLRALIAKSGLFDARWYLTQYPDVEMSGEDPFAHFMRTGLSEGRDPGPGFETSFYLNKTPNLASSGIGPLEHFLRVGRSEGILPSSKAVREGQHFERLLKESGLFDADWYLERYPDVRSAGLDPFQHLVASGAREWRDPGPNFEAAFYAEQNRDFPQDRSISPLEHYLRFGRPAGVVAKGPPAYERWLAQFDELTADDRRRIANDALTIALPDVICFYIKPSIDDKTQEFRASVTTQIGVIPNLHCIDWESDKNLLADRLKSCADGTIVILADCAQLRPYAAYTFVVSLLSGNVEAVYSDHDHLDHDGRRTRPVFKPAMSPDFMRRAAYAGPVIALRIDARNRQILSESLIRSAGENPATAFAELLLSLDPTRIRRIPLCLYSLRSEAGRINSIKRSIYEVTSDEQRREPPLLLAKTPEVRILIPTRDRRELLEPCIESIWERTNYPSDRLRIVVIDNDTREPESVAYLNSIAADRRCAVVSSPGSFNFSKICNDGAAATDGDILVFLNNDITVIDSDWLHKIVSHAVRPDVGAVGTKLLYPDNTVQHGGVVLGVQGVGAHRLVHMHVEETTRLDSTREMSAVTGACLAIRRDVFEKHGGFDPVLAVSFNDADLCARLVEAGYRNIYIADPLLYHFESKSRGLDDTREKQTISRREAIYTRMRHADLFRDDPSYNPNLSLQKVGDLAVPPRCVPPWRRSATNKRVLLLSTGHGLGHGIGCVVALQADYFLRRGWTVTVGGPKGEKDQAYPGCARVELATDIQAAAFAVTGGFDCVIAHTPPFSSVSRYLGREPLFYIYDHGEPPPNLFEDRPAREAVDWEKRFCAPLARRVFAISQSVFDEQYRLDTQILRNGNTHLSSWTNDWRQKRQALRRKFGFEGRFVILNVCRFHEKERRYKGTTLYTELSAEAPFAIPALAGRAVFAIVGRGEEDDVAFLKKAGLTVFPNVSDSEMAELYAASDLYVSLSEWEGYNLGIGQALAMGLDVIASDIPAHREFGIPTANTVPKLCRLINDAFLRWDEGARERNARLEPWEEPLSRLIDTLEDDLAAATARSWP